MKFKAIPSNVFGAGLSSQERDQELSMYKQEMPWRITSVPDPSEYLFKSR